MQKFIFRWHNKQFHRIIQSFVSHYFCEWIFSLLPLRLLTPSSPSPSLIHHALSQSAKSKRYDSYLYFVFDHSYVLIVLYRLLLSLVLLPLRLSVFRSKQIVYIVVPIYHIIQEKKKSETKIYIVMF